MFGYGKNKTRNYWIKIVYGFAQKRWSFDLFEMDAAFACLVIHTHTQQARIPETNPNFMHQHKSLKNNEHIFSNANSISPFSKMANLPLLSNGAKTPERNFSKKKIRSSCSNFFFYFRLFSFQIAMTKWRLQMSSLFEMLNDGCFKHICAKPKKKFFFLFRKEKRKSLWKKWKFFREYVKCFAVK